MAAKAARGQQPKKRPGKAQREAIKRAQAAKKADCGKPAANKAVPLPRGSLRAAYGGTCLACSKDYGKGEAMGIPAVRLGGDRRLSGSSPGTRPGSRPVRRPRPEALGLRIGSSPSGTRPAR